MSVDFACPVRDSNSKNDSQNKSISNGVKIAWFGKHFGEEPPLVGSKKQGAGTIFFTGCNLRCVFCQNYQISQQNVGKNYSIKELADTMLKLQNDGLPAHAGAVNIDLVSPTIWAEQIKEGIIDAKNRGLKIPIVWNSNGYEKVEILKTMKGLVDIYLPDFKYGDDDLAFKYSSIKNYVATAQDAIKEMFRQVGNLQINEQGIAQRGIIVRHMILPNNIENSLRVLKYLSEIDINLYVHLMTQYEPVYKAKDFSEVNRNINKKEFGIIFDYLSELGFENGWVQEMESHDKFLPDFTKENPFDQKV